MSHFGTYLAPIATDRPCGEDIQYAPEFAELAKLRRKLPMLPADWADIAERCNELLSQRSKDLRVAVWLIEARIQLDGYAAISSGFVAIGDMLELYWDRLYPPNDPSDVDVRLSPFEWLAREMPVLISSQPIVHTRDERAVSYTDYVNAQRLERLVRRDPEGAKRSLAKGALRVKDIERVLLQSGYDRLIDQRACLLQAHGALINLAGRLDELCGRDAPSFSEALAILTEMAQFFEHLSDRQRPAVKASPAPASSPDSDEPASEIQFSSPASRDEALAQLDLLASRFHGLDPHSPVPYLLDLAGRWGGLSLEQLLGEIAIMESELPSFLRLMGWPQTGRQNHQKAGFDG